VLSISDFIFLSSAYEGGLPVPSLPVSLPSLRCTVGVLILVEFATAAGEAKVSTQIYVRNYSINVITYYTLTYACNIYWLLQKIS